MFARVLISWMPSGCLSSRARFLGFISDVFNRVLIYSDFLLVFQLACAPCECSFPISAVVGVASLAIDKGAELGGYGIDHINILFHMQIELMMALCRDYTKSCRELQTRSGDMQSCAANNSSIGKFGHGSHRDWYTALREQHAPYAVQSR